MNFKRARKALLLLLGAIVLLGGAWLGLDGYKVWFGDTANVQSSSTPDKPQAISSTLTPGEETPTPAPTSSPAPLDNAKFDLDDNGVVWTSVAQETFKGLPTLSLLDVARDPSATIEGDVFAFEPKTEKRTFGVLTVQDEVDTRFRATVLSFAKDDAEYGLVCRYQSSDNYYFVSINPSGKNQSSQVKDGKMLPLNLIKNGPANLVDFFNRKAAKTLELTCMDKWIVLRADGELVAVYQIPSQGMNSAGKVGMFVEGVEKKRGAALIDQLDLFTPASAMQDVE